MRSLSIDHCPSCRVESRGNTYCARCGVDMVDANGNPRIEPSLDPVGSSVRPRDVARLYGGLAALWLVHVLCIPRNHSTTAMQHIFLSILWWIVELAVLWMLVASIRYLRILAPWTRRRSVAEASSGTVRVRGRVKTLVPPATGDATRTTAVAVRRAIVGRTRVYYGKGSGWLCLTPFDEAVLLRHRLVQDVSVGGRFAVCDATGVAIVDDDALHVLDARPFWSSLRDPLVRIEDGDEIEVIGPAARGSALDACVLGGLPMDRVRDALVFDGRADAKVTLLLRRKARSESARATSKGALLPRLASMLTR